MKNAAMKKPTANTNTQNAVNDSALQEFFVDSVRDIYWAEKNLLKALKRMERAATTEQLKKAFNDHAVMTETHIERLTQVFEILGLAARAKHCDAMAGIIEEGQGIIEETEEGTATRDVGLICAAQKAEHYEIASYGSLATLAKTLGMTKAADLLVQTLEEEKQTDLLLTDIAENDINYQASTEQK